MSVQCTTGAFRQGRQVSGAIFVTQFAHSEVIAILTFVACAQLLTWPGRSA